MSKPEWFRRRTWTDADRVDFNARLNRARGAESKGQYLRIQAWHLAEAGQHEGALELLERLFAEFPQKGELAQGHSQKAASLAELGRVEAAVEEYRAALQAQRDYPQVGTNAWLDFGWLVVEKELTALYEEASAVLQEFREDGGIQFPASEYRYSAIQALLAEARGERSAASEFARKALAEAEKKESGLRYHPGVGLVGSERNTFESRLRKLAAGQ